MSAAHNSVSRQSLRYFGKVAASVSHELKNVLAILNEHAGLLQDLAIMAEQGQPLDPGRIRHLSANLLGQVGRGDMIVRRMNRFAHSAEEGRGVVDLYELTTIVVELFGRTATTRGVTVEAKVAGRAASITTDPFALETLLGSLLDRLTTEVSDIGALVIELCSQDAAGQIRIPGLTAHAGAVTNLLESSDIKALLATLRGTAGFNRETGKLFITLPDDIDG